MLKYNKKELYRFLGWGLFIWYACLRWTIQTNTLGSFITDEHGVTSFELAWIFAPINMITAFLSIYFISKVLVEFDKAFTPLMALLAFFIIWRNCYYTLEDYRDYIIQPTTLNYYLLALILQ